MCDVQCCWSSGARSHEVAHRACQGMPGSCKPADTCLGAVVPVWNVSTYVVRTIGDRVGRRCYTQHIANLRP